LEKWIDGWKELLVRLPKNLDKIDAWVSSMAQNPAHICILHNIFRREARGHNLDANLLVDFFDQLGELLSRKDPDFIGSDAELIREIAQKNSKDFYVRGKRKPKKKIACSRFFRIEELTKRFHLNISLSSDRDHEIKEAIDSGIIKASDLIIDKSKAGPVWVTPTEDTENLPPDDIRDMLGLSHYDKGAFAEIKYPETFEEQEIVAPTVLDGGDFSYFRPYLPSKNDDGWGRSVNLSTLEDFKREGVHRPIGKFGADFELKTTSYIERPANPPRWIDLYNKSESLCPE
jgi:hypothetical protein